MKVEFRESFLIDLRKARDNSLNKRIAKLIGECEVASSMLDKRNVKKLAGSGNFYRIRIGLTLTATVLTFLRVLHRKEIYRYFP